MTTLELVILARERLNKVTPLNMDCGVLCGSTCCKQHDSEQAGMLLFPEEEKLYQHLPEGFSLVDTAFHFGGKPVPMLICSGACKRNDRPLACRFFPLHPYIERNRMLKIQMDIRANPICPLVPYGLKGLSEEFVSVARYAARALCEDPLHKNFIIKMTQLLGEYRFL